VSLFNNELLRFFVACHLNFVLSRGEIPPLAVNFILGLFPVQFFPEDIGDVTERSGNTPSEIVGLTDKNARHSSHRGSSKNLRLLYAIL